MADPLNLYQKLSMTLI